LSGWDIDFIGVDHQTLLLFLILGEFETAHQDSMSSLGERFPFQPF
jgi:hypothetical protein